MTIEEQDAGRQLRIEAGPARWGELDATQRDAYLRSIRAYHDELERALFPAIFSGAPLSALDAASVPRHAFAAPARWPRQHSWLGLAAANLVAVVLDGVETPRLDLPVEVVVPPLLQVAVLVDERILHGEVPQ